MSIEKFKHGINEADLCDDSCKYYCTKGFKQERECLTGQSEVAGCKGMHTLNKPVAVICENCGDLKNP